jgi:tRNA U34 2-thiouridine synthase MnmA/TrmU
VGAVKLRYRSAPIPCRVEGQPPAGDHERLSLRLGEPAEAAAPGQAAVLLDGDRVVGEATIAGRS